MPASYGHNSRGVNLSNLRALGGNSLKNGYRAPYDWTYETHEQVGMGGQEMKLSSSLRHASNQLQSTTHHTVMNDMNSVEDALRVKISQTADLKALLESALMDVISEIDALVALRHQLEGRMGRVQQKLDVNQNRLTVRSSRPARERTMDDVEKNLLTQAGMLNNFVEKVKRSVALVDKEIGQLELLRQKLEADLRDKAEALAVDEAVLSIAPDGTVDTSATAAFKKKHDCIVKTPHTWVRGTEDNLRSAQHWLQDSQRLRKAVRHAMQNSRVAEHAQSNALNDAMLKKLNSTSGLRGNIDEQLQKIRDERTRASAQRASLMEALRAKQGPLAQAKERLALRKARPCRENVNDDVEAALAKEIAHLNAATSQLSDKVRLMDREICQLDGAAATLESNMHDKHSTIGVDERVVMLDGRIHVNSAPPSSVITSRSDLSMAHTQTMHRIKDLEASLVTARRERQDMEATIRQLKDTLTSPYSP